MPTFKAPKTLLREWEAAQADGVNQQQFATLNHLPLHAIPRNASPLGRTIGSIDRTACLVYNQDILQEV